MEGDEDEVYVITITDKLSGSYNSAVQGKALYEDEHNDGKKIYVFNSLATSGTPALIAQKIKEVCDSGMKFDEVVPYINDYIANHCELYFCLDSLDALKRNGRRGQHFACRQRYDDKPCRYENGKNDCRTCCRSGFKR